MNNLTIPDGNREIITLLECIRANRWVLPAFIIFKGKAGHRYEWFTYLDQTDHDTIFAISSTGWTNQVLGVEFLEKLFIPYIQREHKRGEWVLLIVDGHNSHFSTDFIQLCERNHIELFCLPAHSTHLLQPLDVVLFAPLQHHYALEIEEFTRTHEESINKRNFLPYVTSMTLIMNLLT